LAAKSLPESQKLLYRPSVSTSDPALTRHAYGKGTACYQAAALGVPFQRVFYAALVERLGLHRALAGELPVDLAVQRRVSSSHEYLFLQNFSADGRTLPLPASGYFDLLQQQSVPDALRLDAWDSTVLRRAL
jgi:beta-galactosidase